MTDDAFDPDAVERGVRRWLERAVIGLNLCPFARAVYAKGQVRIVVSDASTPRALLAQLGEEMALLRDTPAEGIDTTLLVHPLVLAEFLDFNDFLDEADALLEAMELDGVLQVASFHPDYQFADSGPDDVESHNHRGVAILLRARTTWPRAVGERSRTGRDRPAQHRGRCARASTALAAAARRRRPPHRPTPGRLAATRLPWRRAEPLQSAPRAVAAATPPPPPPATPHLVQRGDDPVPQRAPSSSGASGQAPAGSIPLPAPHPGGRISSTGRKRAGAPEPPRGEAVSVRAGRPGRRCCGARRSRTSSRPRRRSVAPAERRVEDRYRAERMPLKPVRATARMPQPVRRPASTAVCVSRVRRASSSAVSAEQAGQALAAGVLGRADQLQPQRRRQRVAPISSTA